MCVALPLTCLPAVISSKREKMMKVKKGKAETEGRAVLQSGGAPSALLSAARGGRAAVPGAGCPAGRPLLPIGVGGGSKSRRAIEARPTGTACADFLSDRRYSSGMPAPVRAAVATVELIGRCERPMAGGARPCGFTAKLRGWRGAIEGRSGAGAGGSIICQRRSAGGDAGR